MKTRLGGLKKRLEHNIRTKVNDIKVQLDYKIKDYLEKVDADQDLLLGDVPIPNNRRDTIRNALLHFQNKIHTENATTEEFDNWLNNLSERLDEEKCIVCFQQWTINLSDIVVCKHCRSGGHQNHLLDWIKNKKFCPLCRHSLREIDLISIDIK